MATTSNSTTTKGTWNFSMAIPKNLQLNAEFIHTLSRTLGRSKQGPAAFRFYSNHQELRLFFASPISADKVATVVNYVKALISIMG